MRIHSVVVELLHADRRTDGQPDKRTDMTKLTIAFRNFANALQTIYGTESFTTVLATAHTFCLFSTLNPS